MRWKFEIEEPKGDKTSIFINDLLDSEDRARERAEAEFLKLAYKTKKISITTHRTDIKLNEVYRVGGLPYIVKSIQMSIGVGILNKIDLERYE